MFQEPKLEADNMVDHVLVSSVKAVVDLDDGESAKEKARQSQALLASLFDAVADGIAYLDTSGKIIAANKHLVEDMLGYEMDETVGKNFADLGRIEPEELSTVLKLMTEALATGNPVKNFKVTLIRKDNSRINTEVNASIMKKEDRILGIVTVIRDITEQKKADEELRRFSTAVRTSLDGIITGDLNGNIADVNDAVLRMFGGTDKGELIGKNVLDFVVESDRSRALQDSMESLRTGQGKTIEYRALTKNGAELPIEITTGFIKDEQGEPIGFVDIVRNIAERKKAEAKFKGLFMGNPEAAVYLGPDFRIIDFNPRFRELFGYSVEEINGKQMNDIVVPDDRKEEAESLDKDARKGYVYHDTVRKRKDGSLVPVAVSAAPIMADGKPAGYVVMYKDISELKDAEKKLAEINEKLRVVSGLSRHDVRNKLCVVTGNAYLLMRKLADDPKALELLDAMECAVEQITRIFDSVKFYERLGIEKLVQLDVEEAIDEAVSLFSDLHNVQLINDCAGLTVWADSLLRQLFYNLIDNSLKYGEKTTHIRIRYELSGDGHTRLIYEDDGVGIPDDIRRNLFKEGVGRRSGFGLFLIKRMTEVYGWEIQETGKRGKGAQFTITIPRSSTSEEKST